MTRIKYPHVNVQRVLLQRSVGLLVVLRSAISVATENVRDALLAVRKARVNASERRRTGGVAADGKRRVVVARKLLRKLVLPAGREIRLLVLGSWVGARRPFHLSLLQIESRVVLPKILVLTIAWGPGSCGPAART